MRCATRFGSMSKKKDVEAARHVQLFKIVAQLRFEVGLIRSHRGEAADSGKKLIAQQSLEVTNKTEAVGHSQRGQRILCKHFEPADQPLRITAARPFAELAMQSLSAPAAEQGDCNIAVLRSRERFDLAEHSAADILLALEYLWSNRKDTCPGLRVSDGTDEPNILTNLCPYDIYECFKFFGNNIFLIDKN